MAALKTKTLTVRLAPDIKAALRQAADHERRSLANMLEVMIRDWSRRKGMLTDSLWQEAEQKRAV